VARWGRRAAATALICNIICMQSCITRARQAALQCTKQQAAAASAACLQQVHAAAARRVNKMSCPCDSTAELSPVCLDIPLCPLQNATDHNMLLLLLCCCCRCWCVQPLELLPAYVHQHPRWGWIVCCFLGKSPHLLVHAVHGGLHWPSGGSSSSTAELCCCHLQALSAFTSCCHRMHLTTPSASSLLDAAAAG
jgi:hypothetical protein